MKPRKPTKAEKQELSDLLTAETGVPDHDLDDKCIAVFDGYSCMGYRGRLMLVTWDYGPESVDAFWWPPKWLAQADQGLPDEQVDRQDRTPQGLTRVPRPCDHGKDILTKKEAA